jgi:replicative DNA helicase
MIEKTKDKVDSIVKQINQFQKGDLKFLKTGIHWLDYILLGGLKPSDILAICALPFHGKTFLLERIQSNLKKEDDVIFVDCTWELELSKIVARELSKGLNISVRDVYNNEPKEEDKPKYSAVIQKFRNDNMYIQPEPVSPLEFEKDIQTIIDKYQDKKIVVSIDNLENVFSSSNSQKTDMDDILQKINILKKKHPFIVFIILNQLNRDIEDRVSDKKTHVPKGKDIYGTSQLEKISDCLVIINNAYRLGIEEYSIFNPEKRYLYLDNYFKKPLRGGAKTTSFNSIGNIFYHVIKARGIEEEYDMKNLYVEKIFDIPQEEDTKGTEDFDY